MVPEKRYEPANKGISEHSSTVPEPEMLNTCLNVRVHRVNSLKINEFIFMISSYKVTSL